MTCVHDVGTDRIDVKTKFHFAVTIFSTSTHHDQEIKFFSTTHTAAAFSDMSLFVHVRQHGGPTSENIMCIVAKPQFAVQFRLDFISVFHRQQSRPSALLRFEKIIIIMYEKSQIMLCAKLRELGPFSRCLPPLC